jgi:17beta-estradiol 17-dehydrogenase / very-long-chain 3-oxoacyl-CoA reductase
MNFSWQKLQDRYGKGSWAVITGASDGIGKAFCYELAQNGFNIALVARNVSKMDEICRDIQLNFGV